MGIGLDGGRGGSRPNAGRKPKEIEHEEALSLLANIKKLEEITAAAITRLTELVNDPTIPPKTMLEVVKVLLARTIPVASCVKVYSQTQGQQDAPKIVGIKGLEDKGV